MSFDLMAKAMRVKLGNPIKKLVFLKLCDNASDQGECWPSYQHIADQCEIGRTTVIKHINELCDMGYLSKVHRKGEKGNSSNLYYIRFRTSSPSELGSSPNEPPPSSPNEPRTNNYFESTNEPVNKGLDFSCLKMSDADVADVARIRMKNSKTAKQGKLTQRIIDKLAKEFELARYIGWSNAEILDEWECRGWLSFESGWIKPKQPTQQIPESERPNLDKAFDLIFNEWHNKNGMMEARQAFKCKFANFTRQQLIGEMEHMDAYKEYALEKIKSGDKTFIGFDNMKFSTFIEKSRWLDLTKEELGIE